jgi:hypothetical protein
VKTALQIDLSPTRVVKTALQIDLSPTGVAATCKKTGVLNLGAGISVVKL